MASVDQIIEDAAFLHEWEDSLLDDFSLDFFDEWRGAQKLNESNLLLESQDNKAVFSRHCENRLLIEHGILYQLDGKLIVGVRL